MFMAPNDAPEPERIAGLREYVDGSEPWFRERLSALVAHATVTPGKSNDDAVLAGADAAKALMTEAGADARLVPSAGTPAVLGRFAHPEPKARVVIYNHLDVQPADDASWTQADPFTMEVDADDERGFIYRGRGTTDDKGPALCALRAASFVAERGLPIDVSVLWETEEEIGSPNFGGIVAAERDVLSCDAVIVSDTIWPSSHQPAISVALRGSLQAVMRLRTGDKNAHSGLVGGGARNPLLELCRVATQVHEANFWREGVPTPSDDELAGFMRSGFDLEYFKNAHGLQSLTSEIPVEVMLAVWNRPTFEIHGLAGGYSGPGVKTIVPHEGELKTSFRLVSGQDPETIGNALKQFVAALNPDIEVEVTGTLVPYMGHTSGAVHEAIHAGLHAATGREPVTVREGGSIGAVPILAEMLAVPVHFLPLSLPEHGYHAPNECFDWRQARVGMEAFVRTFEHLCRP